MSNKNKKSKKWLIIYIATIFIILVFASIGSNTENSYSKAGEEFETWTKQDPSTWTDVEKQYFSDFLEWSSKN